MKAEEILARALEYEAAGHLELASQECIRYADILWQNGEREEAVAYYETADALSPLPSNARHTLADMYFQLGETSKAAQEYASVASLYAEQGLIDSSIKICKFFQDKLPAETTLSYELADLYLKAERTQRAVNEYLGGQFSTTMVAHHNTHLPSPNGR
jgi:tetratricopeptide (TPR) repeat protein